MPEAIRKLEPFEKRPARVRSNAILKTRKYIETLSGVGKLQLPSEPDRQVIYDVDVFQTIEHITTLDRAHTEVPLLKGLEVKLSGLDPWYFMDAAEGTLILEDGRTVRLLLLDPIKALSGLQNPNV